MNQTKHPLHLRVINETREAMKMFGTYTFGDKGPEEVMDVMPLVAEFRKLPAEEAMKILLAMNTDPVLDKMYRGAMEVMAGNLVCNMQDWDDLWALTEIEEFDI